MNLRLNPVAALALAACLTCSLALASDATPKKKKAVKKEDAPCCAATQDQIDALRRDLQGQIDGLKSDLAAKDAALRDAQQKAADAEAAAARAQAASAGVADNAAAVSALQGTVSDLKANQASLATTVSDETTKIKKEIYSPDSLHYKGVTITPGGYAAGETVWRAHATGGDIPTAFSALPYEHSGAYTLSEFYGSARQSRLSLLVQGKTSWGTLRGYWEADFLGTGITSNNNESDSYALRQRVLVAEAQTNSGWKFSGGQMWSLATEGRKGIPTANTGDILTPQTIDPNYVPGFVWERQYGFRVVKEGKFASFGIAIENPQVLYTASLAGNTPYAILGSAGQNGGNYNAAISASATTTYIQTYKNIPGAAGPSYIPVYNTVVANTNIANISFNLVPDVIVKAAFDPGFGHYEIFGIGRFAHETVYPNVTTDSTKYGGQTDIETGHAVVAASSAATTTSNSIALGGFGGSLRLPLVPNKLTFGVKGLYGAGVGRYGATTLSDVTANNYGLLSPLHNLSGLFTLEATPSPRLNIYLNYGGDYAGRNDWGSTGTTTLGSPSAVFCPTGATGSACTSSPTAAQLAAGGAWGAHWGAPSASAVGYGSKLLSNSACLTNAAPGFSGSSTGYYPGGSCGAQTRNVQEVTGGWWYDIYRGEHGRFRQGFQYGYAVREGWSGAPVSGVNIGAKGVNNMFWTSLRYYLP
jgi:Skp family chaperone for outer membrane proteins